MKYGTFDKLRLECCFLMLHMFAEKAGLLKRIMIAEILKKWEMSKERLLRWRRRFLSFGLKVFMEELGFSVVERS